MTIPTVVCGRGGRMANLIADAVERAPGVRLAARHTVRPAATGGAALVTDLADVPGTRPVVVDFTAREATAALLRQALTTPCPLVIGTSGLGEAEHALAAEAARGRAVVIAANFSLALLALARFVRDLSEQVGEGWDAGVVDVHFAGKRDRPSNTARFLADQWRPGRPGRREPDIGAFRMGDAVSEHRVLAAGTGEHVEVLHRVADRAAFLPGILRAVRFAADAPPGVYSLEDVVCAAVPE
ncbi:4-hydroxy-tetrahydrodipicolinate reductase [Streptomyces ziwulingensis]|uniref:4-hydroxy-tetrahydrodipicolinate reductase n=1 Tax=Streptomyces ziwulingensis TaxID=1045501 RepID=A0ABP9AUZ8_9ACTN